MCISGLQIYRLFQKNWYFRYWGMNKKNRYNFVMTNSRLKDLINMYKQLKIIRLVFDLFLSYRNAIYKKKKYV